MIVALLVPIPGNVAIARPLEPGASLTVATAVSDEVQDAHVVNVCNVLSARVPVAANCADVPGAMLGGLAGVAAIEETGDRVSDADPLTPLYVAVMVVWPAAVVAVANPFDPAALLISAIAVFEESQVTDVVRFCVVLSEYVPVAVNCWVVPGAMLGPAGVTAIDARVVDGGGGGEGDELK